MTSIQILAFHFTFQMLSINFRLIRITSIPRKFVFFVYFSSLTNEFPFRMTTLTEQQNNKLDECKLMCHCDADLTTITMENKYELPMVNRNLFVPEMMYWQVLTTNYFNSMSENMPNYKDNCMDLIYSGMVSLHFTYTTSLS
jgi:hypothetical protein